MVPPIDLGLLRSNKQQLRLHALKLQDGMCFRQNKIWLILGLYILVQPQIFEIQILRVIEINVTHMIMDHKAHESVVFLTTYTFTQTFC